VYLTRTSPVARSRETTLDEGSRKACLWMHTKVVQVTPKDPEWDPIFHKHVILNDKALVHSTCGLQQQQKASALVHHVQGQQAMHSTCCIQG
jgi:hypothetical protein